MRSTFWNKRIPSLLGILFLVGGAFLTSYLVQKRIVLFSQAAPTNVPSNITITNVSDVSFTVVYATSQATTGSIILGTDPTKTDKLTFDDRDQATGNAKNYYVHHITIKNTTPQTTYSFFILSGTDVFGQDNNKNAYVVKTGKAITDTPSTQPPLSGRIKQDSGDTFDAVVVLTPENGAPVSTLVKSDGTYFLPLNALRDTSTQSYLKLTQSSKLSLFFLGSTGNSHVNALISQTDPLPQVNLGQDYDFTTLPLSTSITTTPQLTPTGSITPTQQATLPDYTDSTKNPIVSVTVPTNGTPDDKPTLNGTGVPDETVSIEIHSDQVITDSVTVKANGTWSYRPSTALAPGVHTITVKSKNSKGILQTITESFTVYAQGSQSTEPSVKPLASPTPSPTSTPQAATPTPTLALPTSTPIPTPTVALSTPTPTIPLPTTSTGSASGAIITTAPTTSPQQVGATGNMSALVALGGGLATILTGLVLFVSPKGLRR